MRDDASGFWGPLRALNNHRGGGEYDFTTTPEWHRFHVEGQWLEADEFGNYAAGYSGVHALGELGYVGVRAGGIYYDAVDVGRERRENDRTRARDPEQRWGRRGPEENVFDWDEDSIPAIDAGAQRARDDKAGKPAADCP